MQCVTWLYTKIVCLVYAIVVLVISIKIHLLNEKLVSLTYSQDRKFKIFPNCPTECYQYCVFVSQRAQTSLATWVSVPIHAPDCVCRSLALALCNWFLLIKIFIERNLCVVFMFRRACALLHPRCPASSRSHLAPVPRREISGKLSEAVGSVRKLSEVFGKLSGFSFP